MTEISATTEHESMLPDVPSGTWQIDPAHTAISFAVRHLMSKVRGGFTEFGGRITIAEDRLHSAVQIEIALASVHTGNEFRDNHLQTPDFFDVEQHPMMTFASTSLQAANGAWALDGELTIRGTTRAVQIELAFLGFDPTGLQGEPRIGFEGRTSINRSDFGISFGLTDGGKIVVGDVIDIVLDVEATLTE